MSDDAAVAVETSTSTGGAESQAPSAGADGAGDSYEQWASDMLGTPNAPVNDFGALVSQPKPEAPKPESETGQQPEAQQPKPEERAAEDDIPQSARTIPAEYREIFKANPKLRDSYFTEQAYREVFPTVKAARQVAELFAGGAEDAQLASDARETLSEMDGMLLSSDPEAHAALASQVAEMSPGTFPSLAVATMQQLARVNPEAYEAAVMPLVLDSIGPLAQYIDAAREAAAAGDPERAAQLLDALTQTFETAGYQRQQFAAQREARQEQAAALAQVEAERGQQFELALRESVFPQVLKAAEELVVRSLPAGIADATVKQLAGAVVQAAAERLGNASAYRAEMAQHLSSYDLAAASRLALERARDLLPIAARPVINAWTQSTLAVNKSVSARKAAAARRTEANGGGSPRAGGALSGPVRYDRMSDKEILDL